MRMGACLDVVEPGKRRPISRSSIGLDFTRGVSVVSCPRCMAVGALRLVSYANLCNDFINREGKEIGFEERAFPLKELLGECGDSEICQAITEYERRCLAFLEDAL